MDITEYKEAFGDLLGVETQKISTTVLAGTWATSWTVASRPVAGGYPNSPGTENLDYSNPSAIKFPQAGAGKRSTILKATLRSSLPAGVILFDRLSHTMPQEVLDTTPTYFLPGSLPARATGGFGVEAWLEFPVATTNSAAAYVVVEYTNSDGIPGRYSPNIYLNNVVRQNNAVKVPLLPGDRGVRSVQAIHPATTWTAGQISVVLAKRVCTFEYSNTLALKTYGLMSLQNPVIHNDACLFTIRGSSSTSAPAINLTMAFGEIDE